MKILPTPARVYYHPITVFMFSFLGQIRRQPGVRVNVASHLPVYSGESREHSLAATESPTHSRGRTTPEENVCTEACVPSTDRQSHKQPAVGNGTETEFSECQIHPASSVMRSPFANNAWLMLSLFSCYLFSLSYNFTNPRAMHCLSRQLNMVHAHWTWSSYW